MDASDGLKYGLFQLAEIFEGKFVVERDVQAVALFSDGNHDSAFLLWEFIFSNRSKCRRR